jgi:hypothetical protein
MARRGDINELPPNIEDPSLGHAHAARAAPRGEGSANGITDARTIR